LATSVEHTDTEMVLVTVLLEVSVSVVPGSVIVSKIVVGTVSVEPSWIC
jgi:hypothetical protein